MQEHDEIHSTAYVKYHFTYTMTIRKGNNMSNIKYHIEMIFALDLYYFVLFYYTRKSTLTYKNQRKRRHIYRIFWLTLK